MKNWTISKQLIAGFTALIVVMLCFGLVTWMQVTTIGKTTNDITKKTIPQMEIAEAIRYQMAMCRVTNFKHVLYDAVQKVALDKVAAEDEAVMGGLIAKYNAMEIDSTSKALLAKVTPLWEAYKADVAKLRAASTQNNSEAVNTFLASAGKIGNDLLAAVDGLREYNSKSAAEDGKQVEATVASSQWIVVVVSAFVVVLGIIISLVITGNVSRVLSSIAKSLNEGANQVSSASAQVSSASQSLAEGASEQAASIEETSASLTEISSMTEKNAQNAQATQDLAKQARIAAQDGTRGTREMGVSITSIQAASAEMKTAMEEIKAGSKDISNIIKTIDEIAFQTNLLALNAAVEAARAGEAGAGFAVVADEVRNLAQRSAKAAKETAQLIDTAVQRSEAGVNTNEKVVASVSEVVQKAGEVSKQLEQIASKAQQVDDQVSQIASASKEQSQGVNQVSIAVSQMEKVTQSNASGAEESAAASEELNSQAMVLKDAVAELQKLVG